MDKELDEKMLSKQNGNEGDDLSEKELSDVSGGGLEEEIFAKNMRDPQINLPKPWWK